MAAKNCVDEAISAIERCFAESGSRFQRRQCLKDTLWNFLKCEIGNFERQAAEALKRKRAPKKAKRR